MAMSRSFGATELTSLPSMRISPSLTLSRPAIMARSVDLPQPDGPTSAMNSPVFASRTMPLRASTEPQRLCSRETVSVAMIALSFDGALGQAANEIFAAEEIDQERGNGADHHRSARDVVRVRILLTRCERDQRHRDRLLRSARENDAEQKFVPDAGELPDHGDDQNRRRQGKNDLEKDSPEPGAVDARRLDEVVGDVDVIVAAKQRREGKALDHMDENEAVDRIREMKRAEDVSPGQKRHLARHEDAEDDADEQRLRSRKAPFRKNVSVEGADQGREDRRGDGHIKRVEEVALHAFAGARDAIMRPGLRPRLQREAAREGDQTVLRDLRQFTEGIGDDHEQRQEIDDGEYDKESVDRRSLQGVTKVCAARLWIEGEIEGRINHRRPRDASARPSTGRRERGRPQAPPAS